MKIKLFLLTTFLIFASTAWAESFVVKNIKKEKNLLIAEGLSESEGSKLTVMVSGQECVAQVNKVKGASSLLQFDFNCRLNSIEKGQSLSYEKDKDSKIKSLVVSGVDPKQHLLFTNIPKDFPVQIGSEFTIFSSDRNYCVISVVSKNGAVAALNTRKCSFEYAIQEGMKLEPRAGVTKIAKTLKGGATDSMYFLFAAGYPKISYSGAQDKSTINALENDSSVSHFAFALDLVGVYFPFQSGLIFGGGMAHVVRDGFSGSGIKFEVYQIQVGPSFLMFFDRRQFAKGFFIRGDVGVARYAATSVTSAGGGGSQNAKGQNGFGVMGGIGASLIISDSISLLTQGLYAYRSMGDAKISTITFTLGLLF